MQKNICYVKEQTQSSLKLFKSKLFKKRFNALDKKSQEFLINTAGAIKFGVPIDIRKVYKY